MSLQTQDITPEPLSAHRLFQTSDIDEARQIVAQKFCAHRLTPGRAHRQFETRHNRVAGKSLSLNYLRYSAEVTIDPGELGRFYLIQIPLQGTATVANGRREVLANSQTASVLNPTYPTKMTWHQGCEKLLLQIDRQALHKTAEALTGQHLDHAIVFDPEVDLGAPQLREWVSLVAGSVRAAQRGGAFGSSGYRYQALVEENLMLSFLQGQPSTISHFLTSDQAAPSTRQVRRARTYIVENLSEPLTLKQIALQAGCSLRSLQQGFKQQYAMSPMQYLHQQRLALAHYLMQSAPSGTNVSTIAYETGFTHLGRFSAAYRQAYGHAPSTQISQAPYGIN